MKRFAIFLGYTGGLGWEFQEILMHITRLLLTSGLILTISACAVNTHSTKNGVCNQLRSDLVFGGSTANGRQADIQNAETPLTAKTYDEHCE